MSCALRWTAEDEDSFALDSRPGGALSQACSQARFKIDSWGFRKKKGEKVVRNLSLFRG